MALDLSSAWLYIVQVLGSAGLLLTAVACGPGPSVDEPRSAKRPAEADPDGGIFSELESSAGLDFVHFNGRSGQLYLDEITCGGGALADLDGDGDLDALLLQGAMLGEGKTLADAIDPPRHAGPLTDRLYRNDGSGGSSGLRFSDVSAAAGLPTDDYGCGVAVGDYDGDGAPDLYVANLGRNRLLRNRGDLRFEDVTERAGVGDPRSSVVAAFYDYDGDGLLDLYVGNNVEFDPTGATVCQSLSGARDYCGPAAYPPQADRLYRNRGDGTFEDVTVASGLAAAPPRPTLGAVVADFDGDGRNDLYVANDGEPNNLWIYRGEGRFEDRALLAGSAVNAAGAAEASMGVDAADFDADGDEDLFLAHLIKETNTLYVNDGAGFFSDGTLAADLGAASLPFTSFGTGFLDYDNDGWLDLVVVNGAVTLIPEQVAAGDPFPLHQPNQLFRNLGPTGAGAAVRFADVTAEAGEPLVRSEVSRGAALGDVDNDGDVDVLIVNNNGPARLLINRVGQERRWIGLRLVTRNGGSASRSRDALGARVALLWSGEPQMWRRVRSLASYGAASDPRVVFGLGDRPAPDGLEVRWPGGETERFSVPPAGSYTTIVQGSGSAPAVPTAQP